MAEMVSRNFENPAETRNVPKARIEVVDLGGKPAMRATFEPGWRWSECVKPVAGTESCQVAHLGYVLSGTMMVKMDDGSETRVDQGDVCFIPSGHDAWIVGDEPCVMIDFQGAANYAKPRT